MGIRIDLLDQYGVQQATVNGQRVSGPARGFRKLKFDPVGSSMDMIGKASFELPMALRANLPLGVGTMARIVDTTWGTQGTYIVGDKSETVAADGHWVNFTLADLLEELRWGEIPGFLAQDKSLEPTQVTAQRLLDIASLSQTAYPWQAVFTGTDYFAGTPFQIEGTTPFQAIAKLASDRFLHFRRNPLVGGGNERTLEIGLYAHVASGIRLVRTSAAPARMSDVNIRPIPEGGLTLKNDAAAIVNVIVPTGGGAGFAQLTLQPLWNDAAKQTDSVSGYDYCPIASGFPGYNSQFGNLYRRIRYDGGGLDGYEYFLMNASSIATYRQRWLRYPRTDISTVSTATLDLLAAAQNLYVVATAYLLGHSTTNQVCTVTTIGRGPLTSLAAQTVDVNYSLTENQIQTLNASGPYVVLGVSRSLSDTDGSLSNSWNISSMGQYEQSDATVITGLSQQIDSLRLGATMYPSRLSIYQDSIIDRFNPVRVTVDIDAGVVAIVQAIFHVDCLPLVSPINGATSVNHRHDVNIPGLTVDATVPYTNEQFYNAVAQFNHAHSINNVSGQAAYTHAAPANQHNHAHSVNNVGGQAPYSHTSPVNQANFAHGAPSQYNHGHVGGVGQFAHNHGSSTPATGKGSVNSATASDVTDAIRRHNHTILVQGGGTPSSLGDNVVYIRSNPYHFQASNNSQGQISTDSPGTWSPDAGGHGHGSSFSVGGGGTVSGADKSFTPSVNNDTGFTPNINQHPGFTPITDQHPGFTPIIGGDDPVGFTPTINGHTGFTPIIGGDDPKGFQPNTAFPGFNNLITKPLVTQTSGVQDDPAVKPIYGIYKDPGGAASSIAVSIDSAQIGVVHPSSFTVDLTSNLQAKVAGGAAFDIVFTSQTLGRLIVRGKIRVRETVYKVG